MRSSGVNNSNGSKVVSTNRSGSHKIALFNESADFSHEHKIGMDSNSWDSLAIGKDSLHLETETDNHDSEADKQDKYASVPARLAV